MFKPINDDAIIGHSGFVGETLKKQAQFGSLYRSGNIAEVNGKSFNRLVCAAAPAQKWIANREPVADRRNIDNLISHLKTLSCNKFILISTVDVFRQPIDINENTSVDEQDLHAYGLHRRLLEKFVENHFSDYLIVRLPGLVGPGLRKNVIFDFLNNNNLDAIDSRGVFQFYPMINLWYDIQLALDARLKLLHLTAEPISVADLAKHGFARNFDQVLQNTLARYDMRSCYTDMFGAGKHYQYSRRETIQAVRAYAQSEPHVPGLEPEIIK